MFSIGQQLIVARAYFYCCPLKSARAGANSFCEGMPGQCPEIPQRGSAWRYRSGAVPGDTAAGQCPDRGGAVPRRSGAVPGIQQRGSACRYSSGAVPVETAAGQCPDTGGAVPRRKRGSARRYRSGAVRLPGLSYMRNSRGSRREKVIPARATQHFANSTEASQLLPYS